MVTPFLPDEERRIIELALQGLQKRAEQDRKRSFGAMPTPAGSGASRTREVLSSVRKAIQANVVGKILGLLPREASAQIQGASLLGGIVPVAGTVVGALVGPAIVQIQRNIERNEQRRLAILQARGPFGAPEIVFEGTFNIDQLKQEQERQLEELKSAIFTGDRVKVATVIRNMFDKGRAGAAAARAYAEALADAGIKEKTFAKTAAEQEFNKRQGRVPMKIYRAYSVLYERANREFESFAKDPPLKG